MADIENVRNEFADVFAFAEEQLSELTIIHERRTALTAKGAEADGLVEVCVDAHGLITAVTIDSDYLGKFDLDELGGYITSAARAAAADVTRRGEALMAPLTQRRDDVFARMELDGMPDLDVMLGNLKAVSGLPPSTTKVATTVNGRNGHGHDDDDFDGPGGAPVFPVVKG